MFAALLNDSQYTLLYMQSTLISAIQLQYIVSKIVLILDDFKAKSLTTNVSASILSEAITLKEKKTKMASLPGWFIQRNRPNMQFLNLINGADGQSAVIGQSQTAILNTSKSLGTQFNTQNERKLTHDKIILNKGRNNCSLRPENKFEL